MGTASQNLSSHPPSSRPKIIVAVVAAIVLGHGAVLWALLQMPPMKLRPVTPSKPIKARMVKIVEPPKPAAPKPLPKPPKPVEKAPTPPKPKPVKIVDKPQPPKPQPKIQQVDTPAPQKFTPPPVKTTVIDTTVQTTAPIVENAKSTQPVPPAVDNRPREVNASDLVWKRKPKLKFNPGAFRYVTNTAVQVAIKVDAKGKIEASIVKGSGDKTVDRSLIRAIEWAEFYPYTENGVQVAATANLNFNLEILNRNR